MLEWIAANIGTIVVSIILIGIVAAIVVVLVKNKKKGKSSCGCNCGCCPMNGTCHKSSEL